MTPFVEHYDPDPADVDLAALYDPMGMRRLRWTWGQVIALLTILALLGLVVSDVLGVWG